MKQLKNWLLKQEQKRNQKNKRLIGMPLTGDYNELIASLKSNESIVESAVEMRNKLNDSHFNAEQLARLFVKNPVSDNFMYDNRSNCDTGNIENQLLLKNRKKF